ncbi:hypothetical protein MC7420_5785 [Coleofasciculus chthonoplastes PCC 7420]|uniref:Uncharacterized protein n=2 Tax=Coleofasciculus chthonoplastes TaxID=64178 RepID=B4VW13_9CYAN|nr:hypothetical protein MC7420_5785 [Coleofasciculus chthonoplastes PCC 7420]
MNGWVRSRHFSARSAQALTTNISLKRLAAAMGLTLLSWTLPAKAQPLSEQQLPSSIDQLTNPAQLRRFQQRLQREQPLLYLFLQLESAETENLQQKAEQEIRQLLQQPPSLQQQLFQRQIREPLELDDL